MSSHDEENWHDWEHILLEIQSERNAGQLTTRQHENDQEIACI
jgi:hypothetical protein